MEENGKSKVFRKKRPFTHKTVHCWVAWKAFLLVHRNKKPPQSGINSNEIHKSHGAAQRRQGQAVPVVGQMFAESGKQR